MKIKNFVSIAKDVVFLLDRTLANWIGHQKKYELILYQHVSDLASINRTVIGEAIVVEDASILPSRIKTPMPLPEAPR